MRLGFFLYSEHGQAERLMHALAETLLQAGLPLVGLTVEPAEEEARTKFVRLLPGGERINIWQDLGQDTTSCRLNPGALESALEITRRAIEAAPPGAIVLINKFGKHETESSGTRILIGAALEADLPVLVPVANDARTVFESFAGDFAEEVTPSPAALEAFARGTA